MRPAEIETSSEMGAAEDMVDVVEPLLFARMEDSQIKG